MNFLLTHGESWERLLETAFDAILVLDGARRAVFCNPACERLIGYTLAELRTGRGESVTAALFPNLQTLRGPNPSQRLGFTFQRKDRSHLALDATYTMVFNVPRDVLFVLGVLRESPAQGSAAQTDSGTEGCYMDLDTLLYSHRKGLDQILEAAERKVLRSTLHVAGGRCRKAAEYLGISRSRLYRRLKALGIEVAKNP